MGDTFYAEAGSSGNKELPVEINTLSKNPVISSLLQFANGLLAVLDGDRKIVALNDSLLKMLGIDDPATVLGLRPGEALNCIHAFEGPAGCGTTKFCATCGTAMAIVASLDQKIPVEKVCALTSNRNGRKLDIFLLVKSHPIEIDGEIFFLLFLQDITLQQQRAVLERSFFHDVNNILAPILNSSEVLAHQNGQCKLTKIIHQSALRLKNEMRIQRSLFQGSLDAFQSHVQTVNTNQIMDELKLFVEQQPKTINRKLHFTLPVPTIFLKTNIALILRVLSNMILNALEATAENGDVKIWTDIKDNLLTFYVWNQAYIPEDISLRIFQRNFSTKGGDGRGVGTYSMKLFGEEILGGRVSFKTSPEEGTVFEFSLPVTQEK